MDGIFYAKAAAYLGAAIVMGVGSLGPALGQGMVGMKACESVSKNPESYGNIRMLMILALSIIETSSIYALLVAVGLLWSASNL